MRRSLIIASLMLASVANAETPTPQPRAGEPDIAEPAPDAPPQRVEEAKEVAKEAELTPIIPSPANPTRPAFQLYAEIDLPVLAVGLTFRLARAVRQQPAYCAPSCAGMSLNKIDKLTAGYYSAAWSRASDIQLATIGVSSAAMLIADEGLLAALNDAVVIAEASLSATALATVMTIAAGRPRPFLYSEEAPLSLRNSADGAMSFLSGHTANAFAIATATYMAQRRLHPHSYRAKLFAAAQLTFAAAVGVSRVLAGYHFITDVVGGAAVGSSVGFVVSALHSSPVKVVPVVNQDMTGRLGGGVGVSGTL